ncbi:MAG: uL15 family ribosomal protein [Candidatus Pacebacteria bacterium]|nr:uL15 family ribosomal protein [Candidatus Paceibacterota bacterium]
MQLHNIQKSDNRIEPKARVGRGGKRGKTCGHGHKGQKQHGRHGIRPEMRDFIKKLPKLRGFGKNRARTVNNDKATTQTVSIESLALLKLSAGETITPKVLVDFGLVKLQGGKFPKVKVLSNGDLKVKVTLEGCRVSESAKAAIEKVGGKII